MKALYFEQHGAIDRLRYGELPDPIAKEGEAILRVRAVALNHLDIWVRRGWAGLKLPLPHIGGSDIVGEIVAINGTSDFHLGERVFVNPGVIEGHDEWIARGEETMSPRYSIIGEHRAGGLAEFTAVPIGNLHSAPETISNESLAARILVGMTCWRMLVHRAALKPGESVLVVGSGGGVNSLSIQFARAFGARVIALGGSSEKCVRAKALGAEHAVCYRDNPDWSKEVISWSSGGVDVVIDNVGQATYPLSLRALKRGGRMVTVGNTSGHALSLDNRFIFAKQLSIIGSTMGSRNDLVDALAFMEQHHISPAVDCFEPLANGILQFKRLESGEHFGKIVLRPE